MAFAVLGGCRDALIGIDAGSRSRNATAGAEELFAALRARVTAPMRDPKYDSARMKIANAAFIPSRVWKDTAVWTDTSISGRTLMIAGRFFDGRYRLGAARDVSPPAAAAESRHVIHLTRLSDNEFAWDTDVGYAVGSISASGAAALFRALVAGAEGRGEREVRQDYRAAVPKMAAALGQLFRIDSIGTAHLPDRSTLATFAVTITPDGIDKKYPRFARYMRRYAGTARMRLRLTDRTGATYLESSLRDNQLLLRVRTSGGVMIPLAGEARPMPDSLTLGGDFTMRIRRFTVGFRDYHGDFTIVRADHERSLNLVSRREPDWVLPLLTERFLRAPLRRPFQGTGALFRIGVRGDSMGSQTLLYRRLHLEVQESAILRFIGRLGAIAVADFSGDTEREQYAWLEEVFDALLADMRSLSL